MRAMRVLVDARHFDTRGVTHVELKAAFGIPVGCQIVDMIVTAGVRLVAITLATWDGLPRERQQIIGDGRKDLEIMEWQQIQAVTIVDDIASIDDTAIASIFAAE